MSASESVRLISSPSPLLCSYVDDGLFNVVTNEEEIITLIRKKENQRWNYGLFVMFISIATWMIANQLINSVIKNGEYDHQPLFISYTAGGGFVIYLFPEFGNLIRRSCFPRWNDGIVKRKVGGEVIQDDSSQLEDKEFTIGELIWLSAQISLIYFLNNGLILVSLQFTSSSQQILLSTSTSFFTLLIGSLYKVEVITLSKFGILLLAALGVALITMGDFQDQDDQLTLVNPLLGDLFALCGSFCYSCYLVLIKCKIGETAIKVNERFLFGLVGLSSILLLWPSLVLANYIPLFTPFAPPPNIAVWVIVIMNGVLTAISDYCSVILMLLTSPLVVALSLTTAIPIGMLCDSVFYGINNTGLAYYTGMFLILLSLILTNKNDSTIDTAIEDALEEAIQKDENLSPLLSPLLSPQFNAGVGGRDEFGFEHIRYNSMDGNSRAHVITVSGGYNHKYTIRGLDSL